MRLGALPHRAHRPADGAQRAPPGHGAGPGSSVYFHAELAERQVLPLALSVVGEDRLLYASDFPHEPDDEIVEVLEAFLAREDVSPSAKQKILCENIAALYALK